MEHNYVNDRMGKTEISCEDYAGEKAVVLSRIIDSKLYSITVQDSYNIEEYPRANVFCSYLSATDELFIRLCDKPVYRSDVPNYARDKYQEVE